ncbi:unnamed protein product [Ceratitis capitata]|uniref:(Mediterranean fruit fly) hypothetical protein n=1 Tax=Ceratitis capitata TaxID=7213 RepID=A0A811UJI4_CERCA|nr:unnamed protein product [Ceratitis capitata]
MLNTKRKRQRSAAAITAAAEVSDNRQESLIKEMTFASTALGSPEMRTLAAVNAVTAAAAASAAITSLIKEELNAAELHATSVAAALEKQQQQQRSISSDTLSGNNNSNIAASATHQQKASTSATATTAASTITAMALALAKEAISDGSGQQQLGNNFNNSVATQATHPAVVGSTTTLLQQHKTGNGVSNNNNNNIANSANNANTSSLANVSTTNDLAAAAAVVLSLQGTMVSSLQQAALLPVNSPAAAALNLQALESYLALQRITGKSDVFRFNTVTASSSNNESNNSVDNNGEGNGSCNTSVGNAEESNNYTLPAMATTIVGQQQQQQQQELNALDTSNICLEASKTQRSNNIANTNNTNTTTNAIQTLLQSAGATGTDLTTSDLGDCDLPLLDGEDGLSFEASELESSYSNFIFNSNAFNCISQQQQQQQSQQQQQQQSLTAEIESISSLQATMFQDKLNHQQLIINEGVAASALNEANALQAGGGSGAAGGATNATAAAATNPQRSKNSLFANFVIVNSRSPTTYSYTSAHIPTSGRTRATSAARHSVGKII